MTDREKIIDIILNTDITERAADRIADDLIENDIGDVAEWRRRAEVAEQKATEWKDCANKWQKYYKEQAEREIEEERK